MATKAFARVLAVRRIGAMVLALGMTAPAAAQEQSLPGGFTPDQAQGIELMIRQYLLAHPEVLVESLTAYQQRQKAAQQRRQGQAVIAHRKALREDPDTPVLGNPDGDVVIVEFFDYRCPYCRRAAGTVRKVVEDDGDIRLVMKEFPILGPESVRAARAALAAAKQGKYEEFHFALMTSPGDMSDPHIRQVARKTGLDVERLQRDMEADEIDDMIRRNQVLARALNINGTPAFVIGNTLVPGAIDSLTLLRLVAEARAESS